MVDEHRRSIRLKKYNYSDVGWYFVTICTQNREYLFGNIIDGKMVLNIVGIMIEKLWKKITERFTNMELDTFQIMPNHIHGVIHIIPTVGNPCGCPNQRGRPINTGGYKTRPYNGHIGGYHRCI